MDAAKKLEEELKAERIAGGVGNPSGKKVFRACEAHGIGIRLHDECELIAVREVALYAESAFGWRCDISLELIVEEGLIESIIQKTVDGMVVRVLWDLY